MKVLLRYKFLFLILGLALLFAIALAAKNYFNRPCKKQHCVIKPVVSGDPNANPETTLGHSNTRVKRTEVCTCVEY